MAFSTINRWTTMNLFLCSRLYSWVSDACIQLPIWMDVQDTPPTKHIRSGTLYFPPKWAPPLSFPQPGILSPSSLTSVFFFPITHSIHQQIFVLLSKYHSRGPFSISVTTIHVSAWITKPASYLVSPGLLPPFTIWVLHSGSSDFFRTDIISSIPMASYCTWLMDSLWAGPVDLYAVVPDCSPLPSLILATLTFLQSTHPCLFPL